MRVIIAPEFYQQMLEIPYHTPDCYVRPGEYLHHMYIDGVKYTVAPAVLNCLADAEAKGDEEALHHLAPTAAGYVGMIGSRRKIKLIYEDLIARGVPPAALARTHAPLGLDIGSRTVPEIAVSIVAELIACRNLGTAEPQPRRHVVPETVAS